MLFFTMLFFTLLAASMALPAVMAAPNPLLFVEKYDGPTTGNHIIQLKNGTSPREFLKSIGRDPANFVLWPYFDSFAGSFLPEFLIALRGSDVVEKICEEGVMSILGTNVTQTDAPWGLQRISQKAKLSNTSTSALTYKYTYDSSAGEGVDAYIVDTGINTAHVDFGGRAVWGKTFGGYLNADGNGHGTHCAGIAGGRQRGVAKSVKLIAVKVLSDSGSGAISDIVSGLNWVMDEARSSGRPSVVNLSLGGSFSCAMDKAVASLTKTGVHVVVAAGNSNEDAVLTSPANSPSAITVGATTIADKRASYSNYGRAVDIFAPGSNITSNWIGNTTAVKSLSGTSMATPHVAGLVAYLIKRDGNISPAAMRTRLQNSSVKNAISGIPPGTVNYLANNS
ncbi:hypothetical protein NLJ89_g10387 [Agrocybe chaxingu]|uniref:Peptidase S8/S53 domain-containing protein n=1 Tax=Agrocybe chaxingu TaxID=84603 RepID=A0A9W8JYT0_9AGAR|nr:hypothetical protein NLJ89_g10387 [Agrocybe chaxingu]